MTDNRSMTDKWQKFAVEIIRKAFEDFIDAFDVEAVGKKHGILKTVPFDRTLHESEASIDADMQDGDEWLVIDYDTPPEAELDIVAEVERLREFTTIVAQATTEAEEVFRKYDGDSKVRELLWMMRMLRRYARAALAGEDK